MKRFGAVLACSALIFTVAAYPKPIPDVSEVSSPDADVDKAIRQQSAEFLQIIYTSMGQPQPDASSEVFEELIVASVPDSIRQDVARELKAGGDDGALSNDLKERINLHIIEWSIQYIPEDLQQDIATILHEYQATGQVSGNNDELVERVRQYVDSERSQRGFSWRKFIKFILNIAIAILL